MSEFAEDRLLLFFYYQLAPWEVFCQKVFNLALLQKVVRLDYKLEC